MGNHCTSDHAEASNIHDYFGTPLQDILDWEGRIRGAVHPCRNVIPILAQEIGQALQTAPNCGTLEEGRAVLDAQLAEIAAREQQQQNAAGSTRNSSSANNQQRNNNQATTAAASSRASQLHQHQQQLATPTAGPEGSVQRLQELLKAVNDVSKRFEEKSPITRNFNVFHNVLIEKHKCTRRDLLHIILFFLMTLPSRPLNLSSLHEFVNVCAVRFGSDHNNGDNTNTNNLSNSQINTGLASQNSSSNASAVGNNNSRRPSQESTSMLPSVSGLTGGGNDANQSANLSSATNASAVREKAQADKLVSEIMSKISSMKLDESADNQDVELGKYWKSLILSDKQKAAMAKEKKRIEDELQAQQNNSNGVVSPLSVESPLPSPSSPAKGAGASSSLGAIAQMQQQAAALQNKAKQAARLEAIMRNPYDVRGPGATFNSIYCSTGILHSHIVSHKGGAFESTRKLAKANKKRYAAARRQSKGAKASNAEYHPSHPSVRLFFWVMALFNELSPEAQMLSFDDCCFIVAAMTDYKDPDNVSHEDRPMNFPTVCNRAFVEHCRMLGRTPAEMLRSESIPVRVPMGLYGTTPADPKLCTSPHSSASAATNGSGEGANTGSGGGVGGSQEFADVYFLHPLQAITVTETVRNITEGLLVAFARKRPEHMRHPLPPPPPADELLHASLCDLEAAPDAANAQHTATKATSRGGGLMSAAAAKKEKNAAAGREGRDEDDDDNSDVEAYDEAKGGVLGQRRSSTASGGIARKPSKKAAEAATEVDNVGGDKKDLAALPEESNMSEATDTISRTATAKTKEAIAARQSNKSNATANAINNNTTANNNASKIKHSRYLSGATEHLSGPNWEHMGSQDTSAIIQSSSEGDQRENNSNTTANAITTVTNQTTTTVADNTLVLVKHKGGRGDNSMATAEDSPAIRQRNEGDDDDASGAMGDSEPSPESAKANHQNAKAQKTHAAELRLELSQTGRFEETADGVADPLSQYYAADLKAVKANFLRLAPHTEKRGEGADCGGEERVAQEGEECGDVRRLRSNSGRIVRTPSSSRTLLHLKNVFLTGNAAAPFAEGDKGAADTEGRWQSMDTYLPSRKSMPSKTTEAIFNKHMLNAMREMEKVLGPIGDGVADSVASAVSEANKDSDAKENELYNVRKQKLAELLKQFAGKSVAASGSQRKNVADSEDDDEGEDSPHQQQPNGNRQREVPIEELLLNALEKLNHDNEARGETQKTPKTSDAINDDERIRKLTALVELLEKDNSKLRTDLGTALDDVSDAMQRLHHDQSSLKEMVGRSTAHTNFRKRVDTILNDVADSQVALSEDVSSIRTEVRQLREALLGSERNRSSLEEEILSLRAELEESKARWATTEREVLKQEQNVAVVDRRIAEALSRGRAVENELKTVQFGQEVMMRGKGGGTVGFGSSAILGGPLSSSSSAAVHAYNDHQLQVPAASATNRTDRNGASQSLFAARSVSRDNNDFDNYFNNHANTSASASSFPAAGLYRSADTAQNTLHPPHFPFGFTGVSGSISDNLRPGGPRQS